MWLDQSFIIHYHWKYRRLTINTFTSQAFSRCFYPKRLTINDHDNHIAVATVRRIIEPSTNNHKVNPFPVHNKDR